MKPARMPSVIRVPLHETLYRLRPGGCSNAAALLRRLERAGFEAFEAVGPDFDSTGSVQRDPKGDFVVIFLDPATPAAMHAERLRVLAWACDQVEGGQP